MVPSYLQLSSQEWDEKIIKLESLLKPCTMCPRECGVDRSEKKGVCNAPEELVISSINTHFGEEPPITGQNGSGTVFLTHCNLACIFCQNYPISQLGNGRLMSEEELADGMLRLQERRAHNINFVSPTHYTAQLIRAIRRAAEKGLSIPIVWNSNGYESTETIKLLDGIVDIYLPDLKYSINKNAKRYSRAPRYWETATEAIREMHRQVGTLEIDDDGIASRGIMIRHLVLPGNACGTEQVLTFIAKDLGPDTFIALMAQYFPAHIAAKTPGMDRNILSEEYRQALDCLEKLGLENGYTQEDDFRFC